LHESQNFALGNLSYEMFFFASKVFLASLFGRKSELKSGLASEWLRI